MCFVFGKTLGEFSFIFVSSDFDFLVFDNDFDRG